MSKGRDGRRRRRELERRARKLRSRAPRRQSGESDDRYGERLKPWFRDRVGEGADADELWPVFVRTIFETEYEEHERALTRRAKRILRGSPRPLLDETPRQYAERAHMEVFGRAVREGGEELAGEVQRLMREEVRDEERAKQEMMSRGKYPVARIVQLPEGITAKVTKRAAVFVDENRVDLGVLLEDYAGKVARGLLGSLDRPMLGGYPIADSMVVMRWVPSDHAFYVWERGELPGEEELPVFREEDFN